GSARRRAATCLMRASGRGARRARPNVRAPPRPPGSRRARRARRLLLARRARPRRGAAGGRALLRGSSGPPLRGSAPRAARRGVERCAERLTRALEPALDRAHRDAEALRDLSVVEAALVTKEDRLLELRLEGRDGRAHARSLLAILERERRLLGAGDAAR